MYVVGYDFGQALRTVREDKEHNCGQASEKEPSSTDKDAGSSTQDSWYIKKHTCYLVVLVSTIRFWHMRTLETHTAVCS